LFDLFVSGIVFLIVYKRS